MTNSLKQLPKTLPSQEEEPLVAVLLGTSQDVRLVFSEIGGQRRGGFAPFPSAPGLGNPAPRFWRSMKCN